MTGKKDSHSETRWPLLPPSVVRCNGTMVNGGQCKRVAEPGSVVCKLHGGAAPQVRRRAAERVIMTADEAASNLIKWMNDPAIPWGERVKIARDMLDRAGLVAAQVHHIIPTDVDDPVQNLFRSILEDPDGLDQRPSEPLPLPAGPVIPGTVVDAAQDEQDAWENSHRPDAEVHTLRHAEPYGPYDQGRPKPERVNLNPRPAAPGPAERWRTPDDTS